MKIILSLKGFDSGSGGVPSPISADGPMMSLPIPDRESVVAYEDIRGDWSMSLRETPQTPGHPGECHTSPERFVSLRLHGFSALLLFEPRLSEL